MTIENLDLGYGGSPPGASSNGEARYFSQACNCTISTGISPCTHVWILRHNLIPIMLS